MFINYAHRGASEYQPENTKASFDLGLAMNANGIELDVRKSKDGVLMVYHDDNLKKCKVQGALSDYTAEELKNMKVWLDEKSDFIITFEEFLESYSKENVVFAVELKDTKIEKETLELCKKYDIIEKTIFTSFEYENLVELRRLDENIRLGYLVYGDEDGVLEKLEKISAHQACLNVETATKEMVERYHSAGYETRAWGILDESLMKKAIDTGFSGGVTVNFPDKLKEYLEKI